ncbi:MAG: hypothetical protein GKS01_05595 [Alphaproteobacteria bacterium]|nr:hypothetical protein [Alphaproteobacteria bacterium]
MIANRALKLLGHRVRRASIRQLLYSISTPVFKSNIYKRVLEKSGSEAPKFLPTDIWPGNANRGSVTVEGDFECLGTVIRDADKPWLATSVSEAWLTSVSEFDWLRDLRAVGSDAARIRARELIARWIETHGSHWQKTSWRPSITGVRLANWLGQREFLAIGADTTFLNQFDGSVQQQNRHLQHTAKLIPTGFDRILAYKGLILTALSAKNSRQLTRWAKLLDREIDVQILADGGHVTHSPSIELSLLRHLIDIRSALRDAKEEVSHTLQTAIDKTAPMVRFFRHGDGGLALFNGSDEDEGWLIDVVLTRSEARGKPIDSAPHSGFERLAANRTLVLMDVSETSPSGYDQQAHAGTLSFEMSVGKERVITNCGAHFGATEAWLDAQRTTAAHSTITIEDMNSAELIPAGGIGGRPSSVSALRREADGNIWIDASMLGYSGQGATNHTRRLYLSANGGDIRGEDTVNAGDSQKFVARFHLHPTVQASLVRQANSVLMRTPSGSGWRFKASGGVISLQESVYLGIPGEVKRTEQVVISAATQNGTGQIKWAISRLADEK